ncbi:hypothetical protein D4T97_001925 [Siminovitchia acidinfaciens]|uniref:Uncharacterized protein n=1 Tax=Siminovitchia acidinfaciens TaxID=2321395 RepID=A0A429Y7A2_9BACI|nr:hypothetical protein [Siminovitchia acidinfaciens]RST77272.1 hypothetical protein D4T97_001925 [Siminovitchia acidinfaciens]
METKDGIYIFNGGKFLDFIDVDKFKNDVSIKYEIPKEVQNLDFPDYYSYLIDNFKIEDIGYIFFENILYSHLKNVFVEKISGHPNLQVNFFKEKVKHLINELNIKDTIPINFHNHMSENGFYLMDVLNITSPRTTFIAGFDYTEENGLVTSARFLFVEVVPKKTQGIAYFIAGIDLDFRNNLALTMVRNISEIKKEDEETNTTIHQMHKTVINKVLYTLGISLKKPSVKKDRTGMYNFCKSLDTALLEDIRNEVDLRTNKSIKDAVKKLDKALFKNDEGLNNADKGDLRKKIQALLLSYYIEYNIKAIELVRKAKKQKLVGYPTRIKFTSSKSSRSSTQSSNSKHPVSASDMFHSLYFNFEQALGLDNWSISWFTDYTFSDDKDIDVIQTTVYSTSKRFRIVFLPNRPLDKEIIHYVVNTVNSYR